MTAELALLVGFGLLGWAAWELHRIRVRTLEEIGDELDLLVLRVRIDADRRTRSGPNSWCIKTPGRGPQPNIMAFMRGVPGEPEAPGPAAYRHFDREWDARRSILHKVSPRFRGSDDA